MTTESSLSYAQLQPYLTPDEQLLVETLDPKYKSFQQIKADLQKDSEQENFLAEGNDFYTMNVDDTLDPHAWQYKKPDGQNGGALPLIPLAMAAAPVLSSVAAPLVSKAINGIIGMIRKKKGKGLRAANMRGGLILGNYLKDNQHRLKRIEDDLFKLDGKSFWRNLKQFAKDEVSELAPHIMPMSQTVARHVADKLINQTLPASFDKVLQSKKPERIENTGSGFMADKIMKPVLKWTTRKVINNIPVADKIYKAMKKTTQFIDSAVQGSGLSPANGMGFFDNIKKVVKGTMSTVIPGMSGLASDAVGSAVDGALSRFGFSGNLGTNLVKSALQSATKTGFERVGKSLEDVEEDDDEEDDDEEDDDEEEEVYVPPPPKKKGNKKTVSEPEQQPQVWRNPAFGFGSAFRIKYL